MKPGDVVQSSGLAGRVLRVEHVGSVGSNITELIYVKWPAPIERHPISVPLPVAEGRS